MYEQVLKYDMEIETVNKFLLENSQSTWKKHKTKSCQSSFIFLTICNCLIGEFDKALKSSLLQCVAACLLMYLEIVWSSDSPSFKDAILKLCDYS